MWWSPSSGPMTPPGGRSGPRWPMPAKDPPPRPRDPDGIRGGSASIPAGVRRLRSDLRTLEPLERSWGPLAADLRSLADRLGAVRDLDVLMARMDSAHGDQTALRPMVADLRQRHTTARRLSSTSFGQIGMRSSSNGSWWRPRDPELSPAGRQWRGSPPWRPGSVASRAARTGCRRSTDGELHRPTAAKRARYAAETAARGLEPERAEA